jgi:hypothetical protein
VTAGIPIPKGRLADPQKVAIFSETGQPLPLQTEVLARWSDQTVQWLLVDLLVGPLSPGRYPLTLRPEVGLTPASTIRLTQSDSAITIDTGAATFALSRQLVQPIEQVTLAGRRLLDSDACTLVLTDAQGRSERARIEHTSVESRGPIRATAQLAGRFPGQAPLRLRARVCFFAGTSLVRMRITLHNPRPAKHPGGMWDLGDPGSVLFRDLSLQLRLADPSKKTTSWIAELFNTSRSSTGDVEIYQDSSGGEHWQSQNHVNREGRVPCAFRGYRVVADGREEHGLRATPVLRLGQQVCATIEEFWQQFPKAIEAHGSTIFLRLFPGQHSDLFELQGGEQKTHTIWFDFQPIPSPMPLAWVHQPPRVCVSREALEALPHLAPVEGQHASLAEFLGESASALQAGRELIDQFGWRNFGEIFADHEGEHYDGPMPVISHYNNQYDLVRGLLIQYLRSGDSSWLDLGGSLARHVADIDLYHTTGDKPAYNGGLFWFTDHYKTARTCTHRTYSRLNKPTNADYGGGPSSNHLFSSGLLIYYYLSGDPLGCEAVRELADWVIGMDDGQRTILGLVDDGPTGLASVTAVMSYHGPGRGAGNSINTLLDGWLLTQDRRYLDKAEELIRRVTHPLDDIISLELLNVEKRWSYTVYLITLARYLDLKVEANERDEMYAYARAVLLHYATWMLEFERPYFDCREQLEYPTEAWPGQELRKANVLRLAAEHAGEPLRARLLQRGEELANRAWADLATFESRRSARGVALVLAEGPRDDYFRRRMAGHYPTPTVTPDWGKPVPFVPQKGRVLARLRRPLGLIGVLGALLHPGRWYRWLSTRTRAGR